MEDEFFIKKYNDTVNVFAYPVLLNRIENELYWTLPSQSRIFKTDLNFEIIWEAELSYTSSSEGGPRIYSCILSSSTSEIILQGTFRDPVDTQTKLFLAKISPSGSLVWEKYYDIRMTGVYQGEVSNFIKPFEANYVVRAYESILIISDNGDIVRHKRRGVTGTSSYHQVRGLEVYNNRVYILYNTSNLGDIIVLDDNLDFIEHFRFFGNPERNINAEIRMSRIGSKLFIGFQDVSVNVGILLIDIINDLGSSASSGSLTGKRFTNSFQYDSSYPNELYVTGANLFLMGYSEATDANPITVIYRLDENLNIVWIQQNEDIISPSGLLPTQNAIFLNFFYNSGNDAGILKAPDSLNNSCVSFTSFTDNLISFVANWITQGTNEMEEHSVSDLNLGSAINFIQATEILQICPQTYDFTESRIFASPFEIPADGSSTSEITIELRDYEGNLLFSRGSFFVEVFTDKGSVGPVTYNNDGTYSATLTSGTSAGRALVVYAVNGEFTTVGFPEGAAHVDFIGLFDITMSTIVADPIQIPADGISTATIMVQLRNSAGENVQVGGEIVVFSTSAGTISATTDNGDGTYTATLTASDTATTASLSFTVNDQATSATAQVVFELALPKISQSPHLYLQAAGSTGSDGTPAGIHLRWLLRNELEQHLPKGNLATGTANYNKTDDVVTLFRAPYVPAPININLLAPKAVENRTGTWVYQVGGRSFALYFRNSTQYRSTRDSFDPITQTAQFLQNYGNHILELQPVNDLFFAIAPTSSSTATAARVESEIRSVEGSTAQGNTQLSARKTFNGGELGTARIVTENGKGLRFRCTNCYLTNIGIELYSELQNSIESGPGWTELGQFSLSETDTEVFDRLEPSNGQVNATWPRFNDGAFVNIQNYRDKWNQNSMSTGSNIKQTVQDYISLSNASDNPTALETVSFGDSPEGVAPQDNTFEIPNLLLLQQAAMDFHVARMLGLGHLDVDSAVQNNNPFVYLAVYPTDVRLENGNLVAQPTEHRYITVPTARTDARLPVSVDLRPPVPGIFTRVGIGESQAPLTDGQGYTQDGKTRYLSLFLQEPVDPAFDRGFYNSTTEFNLAQETFPVFAGLEYKGTAEQDWRSPELANIADYKNVDSNGQLSSNESIALPIPDEGTPLFVHRQTENGQHTYGSYGINWFSRISRSPITQDINTTIAPKNTLAPPGDRSALLIIEEQPLLLTTANEQQTLAGISGTDKTLVRLLFNYHTNQELLSYLVTENTLNGAADPLAPNAIFPDDQEVFANEVEIYFRPELPLTISGKARAIDDDPGNELLSVISTEDYRLASEGESVVPNIPTGQMANFIGGVLVLEEEEYIIHSVSGDENSPTIKIYKKQASDRIQDTDAPPIDSDLLSPVIREDGRLLAVENLQNASSWGTPNPHPLKVQLGNNWPVHREVITRLDPDGLPEQHLQKTRGIWDNATIERVLQPATPGGPNTTHLGQYKATFGSTMLADHPQASGANPVQWYRGIVRIHTTGNPNGDRRDLEVYKIENIGTGAALIVYFKDKDFRNDPDHDEIQLGGSVQVNFYPGYRIHLFANPAAGITASTVLPQSGEGVKYSCFGFRSMDSVTGYASRIAIPTVLFAQEEIAPLVPQLPIGAQFATRPDGFGKATYTFSTQFDHTPHGTLFYRMDENAILNALYTLETVNEIKAALLTSDLDFLPNRWQNLLGFDYEYPSNSFQTDGLFAIFPETTEGYRFPNPNNPLLFLPGETPGSLTPGSIADRIKVVVLENFVPLTEIPLLYKHINGTDYNPVPKKQVIRDRNGQLLVPSDPKFDMAPMAKIPSINTVQFTDFTLDGTSNNRYFYASRELSSTMQMGDYSPILGPINLVNTNPPIAPGIQQVVPILENTDLGIAPGMEVSVNAYPTVENIKKLALYRALNATDALSIRSMKLVKEIDPSASGNTWRITDDFADLQEIPFGDPLFYRVIAAREIQYADKDDSNIIVIDDVPSGPSKLLVTAMVENTVPEAPDLTFTGDPVNAAFEINNVILEFNKTVYNGKYLLFKLNDQGQWVKIHEVTTNDELVSIPLDTTNLGSGTLVIEDAVNDNQSIYHQFKIDVENTAGLISQQSNILTIPTTNDYDGIGGMGIEETFIIR